MIVSKRTIRRIGTALQAAIVNANTTEYLQDAIKACLSDIKEVEKLRLNTIQFIVMALKA
jgi:hypothetical protein